MRSQKLVITLSAAVTAVFLVAVGVVVVKPYLERSGEPAQRNFGFNNLPNLVAPNANVDAPNQREQQISPEEVQKIRGAAVPTRELTVSASQTHGNLSIFLVHGPDTIKETKIVTLQEGIEQGAVVVHETGGHQLLIDNRGNAPLFIQAGDIVKGGTQDRTLPFDMLISANTQGTPVTALCVEQGRSRPRAGEISTSFGASTEQLPGRDLRLAAYRQNQNVVWNNVQNLQNKLAQNAGGSVQAPLSKTSLQLSIEHQRVQDAVQDTVAKLAPSIEGKNDVIGFAVVVNGRIQSADVYASNALFQKLWPKLIRSSAVAALADRQPGAVFNTPTKENIQAFLTGAEDAQAVRVQASNRSNVIRQETAQQMRFDTCDPGQQNVVLHRAFLVK